MRLEFPSGSSGRFLARLRWGIHLIGAKDGVNRAYNTPEPFIHLPGNSVRVIHCGRRINDDEFSVSESIPGMGFDTILLTFAPTERSTVRGDYIAAQ